MRPGGPGNMDGLAGVAVAAIAATAAFVTLVPYPFIGGAAMHGVPVLRLVPLAVGCVLSLLTMYSYLRMRETPGPGFFALPVLFLFAVQLVGAAGSIDPAGSISKALFYAVTGIGFYFAAARYAAGRAGVLLWTVLACAAFAGAFSVVEFISGSPPLYYRQYLANNPYILYEQLKGRSFGTLGHPVFMGAMFVLAAPAGYFLMDAANGVKVKALAGAMLAVTLAGLLFTYTRSAYAAVAVSAIVYYRGRIGRRHVAAALVVVALVGGLAATSTKVRESFSRRDPVAEYIGRHDKAHRLRAFEIASRVVADVPLMGMGVGNYRALYDKYRTGRTDTRATYATPDNMYLVTLMESGLAGLGLLLYVLWRAFTGLAAAEAGAEAGRRRLLRFGAAMLAGFAVAMFFFDALYVEPVRVVFWSLLGVSLGAAGGDA